MTVPAQPAILETVPGVARYLFFTPVSEARARPALRAALQRLAGVADGNAVVVGLGPSLVAALGASGHGKDLTGYEDGTENPSGTSMPRMMGTRAGLMFVPFGKSHDAFELQMRRMAGAEDGVTDAMFRISRPVTGAHLWCPPIVDGRLDLCQLGL